MGVAHEEYLEANLACEKTLQLGVQAASWERHLELHGAATGFRKFAVSMQLRCPVIAETAGQGADE